MLSLISLVVRVVAPIVALVRKEILALAKEPSSRALLLAPALMQALLFGYGATFDLTNVHDLYLDTSAWGKGVAWVNGFCLGRYWSRGPQHTLYVPAPALRATGNELIVFELHAIAHPEARFVPSPDLGHTEL